MGGKYYSLLNIITKPSMNTWCPCTQVDLGHIFILITSNQDTVGLETKIKILRAGVVIAYIDQLVISFTNPKSVTFVYKPSCSSMTGNYIVQFILVSSNL